MDYNFFSFINRMKYINRWGLMRNTRVENVAEHSFQTAVLAHALACIEKTVFGGNVDPEKAAALAVYHETAEVITGDLPTPVKYFNDEIKCAYKDLEKYAAEKLLNGLPDELRSELGALVTPKESEEKRLVKYADKLAAYIKCIEEKNCGNNEFDNALAATEKELKSYNSRAVDYFMDKFVGAYYKNLDQLI